MMEPIGYLISKGTPGVPDAVYVDAAEIVALLQRHGPEWVICELLVLIKEKHPSTRA